MDYKEIKELIKTISDSKVTSFEIETDEIKIKIGKEKSNAKHGELVNEEKLVTSDIEDSNKLKAKNLENAVKAESRADEELVSIENDNKDDDLIYIKSPIVGTFYSSPSKDEPPFVLRGQKVKKGDVLCIIEAMKLMNEIEAEDNYEIVEVLAQNEDMVEYGSPLFTVKKL